MSPSRTTSPLAATTAKAVTRGRWRTIILGDSVESKLVLIGIAGAVLFCTLVATLFFVQRALVSAQEVLTSTTLPVQRALDSLEGTIGSAFERQAKIASVRILTELDPLRDDSGVQRPLSAVEATLDERLTYAETRANLAALRVHANTFLKDDQALFASVERKLQLRSSFEQRLSQIDADLRRLIESANALSGVLQLDYVLVVRQVAQQMKHGSPSPALLRAAVMGSVRVQREDVVDLVQGVIGLGWLTGKTGLAISDDALNTIVANEISQNQSRIERLLEALQRRASPGSETERRVVALAEQFQAVVPRIADETRGDSLVRIRRDVLAEARRAGVILASSTASARLLTADVAALEGWSRRLGDETARSSQWTTLWVRLGSLLVSLVGLVVCLLTARRIRDSLKRLRATNHELRDLRDNLELKVKDRTNELSVSREQFRILVETTNTVPYEMDLASRRFVYMGPQAGDILGIAAAACLAPDFLDQHLHPEDRDKTLAALAALAARNGASIDIQLRLRRADQKYGWVRLIGSTTTVSRDYDVLLRSHMGTAGAAGGGPGDQAVRGILLDVTEAHEMEMQLRQAQKLESVGRLASGVAHEINTPVQFVSDSVTFVKDAFADIAGVVASYQALRTAVLEGTATVLLAEEIGQKEEAADLSYLIENTPPALARSIDGLERIADIVRSMKEFAHPDQKEKTTVDLNRALSSTLTIARTEYKYVADVETDFAELPAVTCHAGEVNQVFLNIIVNAAHAIGDVVKGTEAKGLIRITSRQEGDDVVVRVSDTGGGIPVDIRDRIFDPFFTTKDVGKGTGQGLAIARSVVVDKHGGEIHVESEVGKGSTFVVRLPIDGQGHAAAPRLVA